MDIQGNFFGELKEVELEDWRAAGKDLRREHRSRKKDDDQWKWKLGDWLLTGQNNLGERKTRYEAPRIWNIKWGTLKNFRWVSSVFPPSRRRDRVSWEHHRVVAALKEKERDECLDNPSTSSMPIRQLKASLTSGRRIREEFADLKAASKGEFPLLVKPIKISFTRDNSAVLQYLFESGRETHGQKNIESFLIWLTQKGMESQGWMPKVKEFLADRKVRLKAREAEINKDFEESKKREEDFKQRQAERKTAWEKSRSGTSNQT